jgi:hypothetical protein
MDMRGITATHQSPWQCSILALLIVVVLLLDNVEAASKADGGTSGSYEELHKRFIGNQAAGSSLYGKYLIYHPIINSYLNYHPFSIFISNLPPSSFFISKLPPWHLIVEPPT